MSRRTGKAATRRARQQRRTRQGPSPAAAAPQPAASEPSTPESPPSPAHRPPSTPAWASASSTSSRLGESARAEYHYVARDLRNTAVLVVIMAAMLAAAVVAVNLAGVAPQ